jgi:hypothetical protein
MAKYLAKLTGMPIALLITITPLAAQSTCYFSRLAPDVGACDDGTDLNFIIGERTLTVSKSDFQGLVRQEFASWLTSVNLPQSDSRDAQASVWLSVPELNPYAVALRIVWQTEKNSVVISRPLTDQPIAMGNQMVGVIESYGYPDSFGWRPEVILMGAKSGVSRSALSEKTSQGPGSYPDDSAWPLLSLKVPAFSERAYVNELRGNQKLAEVASFIEVNAIREWQADRFSIFNF